MFGVNGSAVLIYHNILLPQDGERAPKTKVVVIDGLWNRAERNWVFGYMQLLVEDGAKPRFLLIA